MSVVELVPGCVSICKSYSGEYQGLTLHMEEKDGKIKQYVSCISSPITKNVDLIKKLGEKVTLKLDQTRYIYEDFQIVDYGEYCFAPRWVEFLYDLRPLNKKIINN